MRAILWIGLAATAGCKGGKVDEGEFEDRYRAGVCAWVEACAGQTFTSYYEDAADCEESLVLDLAVDDCEYDPEQAKACIALLEAGDCEADEWVPDGAACSASYACPT